MVLGSWGRSSSTPRKHSARRGDHARTREPRCGGKAGLLLARKGRVSPCTACCWTWLFLPSASTVSLAPSVSMVPGPGPLAGALGRPGDWGGHLGEGRRQARSSPGAPATLLSGLCWQQDQEGGLCSESSPLPSPLAFGGAGGGSVPEGVQIAQWEGSVRNLDVVLGSEPGQMGSGGDGGRIVLVCTLPSTLLS